MSDAGVSDHAAAPAARQRTADELIDAWIGLGSRAGKLLRDTESPNFAQRVQAVDHDLLDLVDGNTDASLLLLIQTVSADLSKYSATHALLVAAVCELAARRLEEWPAEWRLPLRQAALTMNLSISALQDQLAAQDRPISAVQRDALRGHGERSADQLHELGIRDALWLQAVRQHHAAPAGPLSALAPELQIARLVQRADIFAARLSPRKLRASLSATAAAKTAYFDEREQPDEAGAAIIKAVGIYPPGSFVRLVSADTAIVLSRGKQANQPIVASIVGPEGMPFSVPRLHHTDIASHRVVTGVAPHDVRVRTPLDRLLRLMK